MITTYYVYFKEIKKVYVNLNNILNKIKMSWFIDSNSGLSFLCVGNDKNSLNGLNLIIRTDGLICFGQFSNNELNGDALIWLNERGIIN